MKRVVIVGGGITGLATAHALEKAREPYDVKMLEADVRLGGSIITHGYSGFTIDGGPDSWVAEKTHATRLAREVGLGDELIAPRPEARKLYVLSGKTLHGMPVGIALGLPTDWRSYLGTELLELDTKLRVLLESMIPPKTFAGDEDESIASFVARRLGAEVQERIGAPLARTLFAGDAGALSVRACLPQLVDAEAKHGSLVGAMRALRERREGLPHLAENDERSFVSLKGGMGDLVTYVAHRLRDAEVSTNRAVVKLARLPEGDPRGPWAVETSSGTLFTDHVALTVPAHASSSMVSEFDATLSRMLGDVAFVSTATVALAYRNYDMRHPLDAAGVLVPRGEGRPIVGCTFVSSKWDHRAPSGQSLVQITLGGAGAEHILSRDDDALVRLAREQLRELVGIERPPVLTKVFRFDRSSPQRALGHLGRVRRLMDRAATWPGLYLGGSGLSGAGVSEAIKQGEEIAMRINEMRALLTPSDRTRQSRLPT